MFVRALFLLMCAAALRGQHSDTALINPFRSPDDRARGGAFFRSQCANCHGIDGKGGASGPNLSTGTFRHASSDEGLFRVITRGVPGTSMPGFSMNGREIWQIVAYVRSLSANRVSGPSAGDPARGKALVRTSGCLNCHWLNGSGAPRGLDLTSIGERLSLQELRTALTDPDAEVAPEYWLWEGVTLDNQTLGGSRLNEDTFSLQILDRAGRLRSVMKADLRRQTLEKRSSMPSYREKLDARQLDDVVAYLASLRGGSQ